ncbi:MAG TPA: Uma2 family endonuclease [Thermoanaerobaculia bacterium]|nr:Uma2 family endonuclease [Thermoanaerobaculia bacterium]
MAEPVRKAPADDPYPYGWGLRRVRLPDGRVEVREVPLTPEDFLDPQPGDQLTQNYWHGVYVARLFNLIYERYESSPDVLVSMDFKMLWGIPDLSDPAPDVAVIQGVHDKMADRRSFSVQDEGARPCLVVEVVSDDPALRSKDHKEKIAIYERAGVQEYLILDPPLVTGDGRFRMTAYRLGAGGRYRRIQPDDQGGFLSRTTGLWFRLTPDRQNLFLVDARTGERLEAANEAKARAAYEAEQRRAAETRATLAEARSARDTEARKEAEARAARAEAQAAREAAARREAEAETARLREELAQLQKSRK